MQQNSIMIDAMKWQAFKERLKTVDEMTRPKEVIDRQQIKGYLLKGKCPNCKADVVNAYVDRKKTYCEWCGQLMNWGITRNKGDKRHDKT